MSELVSYTDQQEHIYRDGLLDNVTVFDSYSVNAIEKVRNNISTKFFYDLLNKSDDENCISFSGGEKQAIAFMRMMAKDSDVILMDESFSAVDVYTRSVIEKYLFTAKEFQNKTVLIVTHDTSESYLSLFDKIIHVENGKVYVENVNNN